MVKINKDEKEILASLVCLTPNRMNVWNEYKPMGNSSGIASSILYGNGRILVSAFDRARDVIYEYTDDRFVQLGVTRSTLPLSYPRYAFYADGKFVFASVGSYDVTVIDEESTEVQTIEHKKNFRGMDYFNGKFFLANFSPSYITTDFVTFQEIRTSPFKVIGFAHDDKNILAFGYDESNNYGVKVSNDGGDTWSEPIMNGNDTWSSVIINDYYLHIAYGDGRFVAVGKEGYITESTDGGVTWSTPIQIGHTNWNSITYGNGRFVAVGEGGYISIWDNGTWSEPKIINHGDNPDIISWYGVSYYNNKFIALGGYYTRGYLVELKETIPSMYTLAYGKDTIYAKSTGVESVPVIYAKNNEQRSINVPNVTIVGNLQSLSLYEPDMLTGFSSNKYATLPDSPAIPLSTSTSWDMSFTFCHRATGVVQRVFSQGKAYPSGIEITTANKLRVTLSTSTSKYNVADLTGTYVLKDGWYYNVVIDFNGSEYKIYLYESETQNEQKTLVETLTKSSTTKLASSTTWKIGYDAKRADGACVFSGVICLDSCSIRVTSTSGESFSWGGTNGSVSVNKFNYDTKEERTKRYL